MRSTYTQVFDERLEDSDFHVVRPDGRPVLTDTRGAVSYKVGIDLTLSGLGCVLDTDRPTMNPLIVPDGITRVDVTLPPLWLTDRLLICELTRATPEWFDLVTPIIGQTAWAVDRAALLAQHRVQRVDVDAVLASHGVTDALSALRALDLLSCPVAASDARLNCLALLDTDIDTEPWFVVVPNTTAAWTALRDCLDSHADGGGCALLSPLWQSAYLDLAIPALEAHLNA